MRTCIRDHPYRSQCLGSHSQTGNLGDCRKKFFHDAKYRVIYRLLPDERQPKEADVIVVGSRAGLAVYTTAVLRLGR